MVDPRTDNALAMDRREQARQMRREGATAREIARALGRSVETVRGYLWQGGKGYGERQVSWPQMSVREKAEELASCYPDDKRRDWIRRQFGVR